MVRVARARPIVLLLLARATRFGTLAVIVTGAAPFWPMRLVALVPAFEEVSWPESSTSSSPSGGCRGFRPPTCDGSGSSAT